jgi:hypothetical protein
LPTRLNTLFRAYAMRRKDQTAHAARSKDEKSIRKRAPHEKAAPGPRQLNKNKAGSTKTNTHHSDTKRKADFEATQY